MEVSPTPSPQVVRKGICVSPGTALCDEKRNAVLQQLLESPVPPAKEVPTKLHMERVEAIMQPSNDPAVANHDGFGGFDFRGETSSVFGFQDKPDDDFTM